MSTTTITLKPEPMSLWHLDFPELYSRHLCRHSQFGINVLHLIALGGVWFGVYALAYWLFGIWWLPVAMAGGYFAAVALHTPVRIWVATAVFLAGFVAAVFWLPELPFWGYLIMIPVFYEAQVYSHKVWTASADMTEFNRKYPKGRVLFVILLLYEIPLLLNYLVFDSKSWRS